MQQVMHANSSTKTKVTAKMKMFFKANLKTFLFSINCPRGLLSRQQLKFRSGWTYVGQLQFRRNYEKQRKNTYPTSWDCIWRSAAIWVVLIGAPLTGIKEGEVWTMSNCWEIAGGAALLVASSADVCETTTVVWYDSLGEKFMRQDQFKNLFVWWNSDLMTI